MSTRIDLDKAVAANIAQAERSKFFNRLHRLCGYIECGDSCTVRISQDDATRGWSVRVGDESFYGDTLPEAFDKALAAANKHFKDAYDLEPV